MSLRFRFRVDTILWIMLLVAVCFSWAIDRTRLARKLAITQRQLLYRVNENELLRDERNAATDKLLRELRQRR
jgi:hypothetical protein